MVAIGRQFLVLFLVVLQFAAPLVHAHIGEAPAAAGLHLHEFESMQQQGQSQIAQSLGFIGSAQSAIVELGSAIKSPASAGDIAADAYLPSAEARYVQPALILIGRIPPPVVGLKASSFEKRPPSRAPPV